MNILLDVDGVLADFIGGVIRRVPIQDPGVEIPVVSNMVSYDFESSLSGRQVCAVNAIVDSPGFPRYLEPIEGAVEGVQTLRAYYDSVLFVTAPAYSNPTWVADRMWWLEKYFEADESEVVFTSAKHQVRGGVLLDDKLSSVREFNSVNGVGGILYRQPWNVGQPDGMPVVHNWDEAVTRIDTFFTNQGKKGKE